MEEVAERLGWNARLPEWQLARQATGPTLRWKPEAGEEEEAEAAFEERAKDSDVGELPKEEAAAALLAGSGQTLAAEEAVVQQVSARTLRAAAAVEVAPGQKAACLLMTASEM